MDLIVKTDLKKGMLELLRTLAHNGNFNLDLMYYSSRNDRLFETNDKIEYKAESELMRVLHEPYFAGKPAEKHEFMCTPEEYIDRLVFPENITFIDIIGFTPDTGLGGVGCNKY